MTNGIWEYEIERMKKDWSKLRENSTAFELATVGLDDLLKRLRKIDISIDEASQQMIDFLAEVPGPQRIIVARDLYRRTQGELLHKAAAIAYKSV